MPTVTPEGRSGATRRLPDMAGTPPKFRSSSLRRLHARNSLPLDVRKPGCRDPLDAGELIHRREKPLLAELDDLIRPRRSDVDDPLKLRCRRGVDVHAIRPLGRSGAGVQKYQECRGNQGAHRDASEP
jgi:hypothetical protein